MATIRHAEVDAVTIGVGWTAGILAAELTRAGHTVVGLERGQLRGTQNFLNTHDELRFAVDHDLMQDPAQETWTLRHDLRETALPFRNLGAFLPGTDLGGSGIHWNGQTFRFHPRDFTIRSSTIERYGKNAIPPAMSIADWGITYEELEPYYDRFEYMAGIAGKAGNLRGHIVPGGNPFEGPRSREYPVPPMKEAQSATLLSTAAAQLGYHPFPQPSANLPQVYTNPDGITRNGCTYCGFCERFGCEVGAKASAPVTVIPVALATGKFEIRTGANVFEIKHDGKHAQSVLYYDAQGRVHEQPAKTVLVTAFTFNNTRLLLNSKMGRPYDPRTRQGVVGRNFTHQIVLGGSTFWADKRLNRYMGSGANGTLIDDFGADNFDHHGLGFIGGASIIFQNTGARPIQQTSVPDGTPKWGAAWKDAVRTWYDKQSDIVMQGECKAYWDHCLELDPTYRDQFGNPLLRITFDFQDDDRMMMRYISGKVADIMRASGATKTMLKSELAAHYDTTVYQTTHVNGGTIMGSDPHHSVVNNWLQMWDFENVFVVGASAFPQNACFNPTGTVGALAYRAADGLVNRYFKKPGPLA
jgi:gluconate 2-dehydrogenase alpha chain